MTEPRSPRDVVIHDQRGLQIPDTGAELASLLYSKDFPQHSSGNTPRSQSDILILILIFRAHILAPVALPHPAGGSPLPRPDPGYLFLFLLSVICSRLDPGFIAHRPSTSHEWRLSSR